MTRFAIPLLFVFLWSTGFIFSKLGLPYAEPLGFLALRFSIAAVLLILLIAIARPAGNTWQTLGIRDVCHSAVAGILLQAIYLGGVFSSIAIGTSAGLSALIVGLQPLLTVILATLWLKESFTLQKIAGILLGLAGVTLVILERGQLDGTVSIAGLLLCIAALLAITTGSVYQKRFCTGIPLLPSVTVQYIASVLFLFPLALALESLTFIWTPVFVFTLTWLILALSLGAVFILMWLIKQGEAGRVATLFYLVPPVVALEAWVLFNEKISMVLLLGTVMCIAGVAVVMLETSIEKPGAK